MGCSSSSGTDRADVGDGGVGKTSLVDNNLWVYVDAASDPLAGERPADLDCPDWAYTEEYGTFEVDTGACAYLSVSQPSLATVQQGETVHISIWHDVLISSEPGDGHAAIAIGGDVIWEATFEIPSYPNAYSPKVVVDKAYPVGTPIVFHLHNHGSNNWRLLSVSVEQSSSLTLDGG